MYFTHKVLAASLPSRFEPALRLKVENTKVVGRVIVNGTIFSFSYSNVIEQISMFLHTFINITFTQQNET